MKKTALISVYDKSNLDVLLKKLSDYKIIATGTTYDRVVELGYSAIRVEDVTNFKEILGGRVKTLHPNIFGGILSRRDEADNQTLIDNNIESIDVVVCNLYPFKDVVSNPNSTPIKIIENIDIGGVSLIRAAAKNFMHTSILIDTNDYAEFDVKNNEYYAAKGFKVTNEYDTMISNYFAAKLDQNEQVLVNLDDAEKLAYGENRHQEAMFVSNGSYTQLQGKELSYNNILDIEATINLVSEFDELVTCAIKHNTPCGVGFGASNLEAYTNCYNVDPLSIFGGIVGFNNTVDADVAKKLVEIFLEVIIAPDYTPEALEIFKAKKNLRVIKLKDLNKNKLEIKHLNIGIVAQTMDNNDISKEELNVVAGTPSKEVLDRLVKLQKVCKHVKSNAIVIGQGDNVVALNGGQTSRVDALRYALEKISDKSNLLLASDAFFPFTDAIELAIENSVVSIIQPGGSIRDEDVIKCAKDNNVDMVLTGVRHFRH